MKLNNLPALSAGLLPLGTLAGANRPIRLRLPDTREDLLLVKHVSGTETICGGIEYSLLCVSAEVGLPLKQFIASPVELQFVTDTGGLRSVCGIVASVVEGQGDGGLATYQLIVRDALSLLEKSSNTRVFRNASEIDITNTILREWREANPAVARTFQFDLGHLKTYPAREFTMQYNESTSDFLQRLWKRRGIAWFIRPSAASDHASNETPAHTLVLFDDAMSLAENAAGAIRYHRDDGTEQRDTITAWHAVRRLTPGIVNRRSWDYAQAWSMGSQNLNEIDQGKLGNQFANGLDDYLVDVPHAGDNDADYRSLGTLRMQRHEYESKFFQGEGSDRNMCVGQWNRVTGHPELDTHPEEQREFVITELRVEAENNLPKAFEDRARRLFALNHWRNDSSGLEQASAERGVRYTNRFTCVRRGIPIVPHYDPRVDLPRTEAQSVTVVGPTNEEIHCDALGRVKIRFAGCRDEDHEHANGAGASDSERDSAWVRVASGWASAQYGAISLPRAGDEVICVFLGGDPDKPLIIGRVHGGKTTPPSFSHRSRLPGDKYLSGIKSKEVKAQRYNQLRMDDTPGQISAQLASEHGHSQLNLGYLTHPRTDGEADPRGEGFELATNDSGAIRTAKSLLISAWKRLDACGNQLSSDEHLALMQDCLNLFKSLGQYAAEHQGLALDPEPQTELKEHVDAAAGGSNTDRQRDGGQPTLSMTAPAGIALSTPKTMVSYAGVNVDTVAQQHLQFTSGQRFNLNAGKGISLFSHMDGITQVAHKGKFLLQSQLDDIQINSAKDIKITASKRLIIMAEDEVTLMVSGGAYLTLKGGNAEIGGPGPLTVKTDGHHWNGPASATTELPKFESGDFGRVPRLLRATDGKPVEGMQLHVERVGDSPMTGRSDGAGTGEKIVADRLQQIKAIFYRPRK
ncbi:type VI secretion system Vgr family protein [Duganella sp. Root1480D1]|uniref:type VI secretion system Vgr family protein n=1 Tax=Duganella sp. Root1480D1 TaxID=1736471 RepID=UPI0009EA8D99|nr:type VI secretion system Vgr family protein [Duganella sp. Root1480D1]